jgi:tetratricopeptide (TPR) repeat protein
MIATQDGERMNEPQKDEQTSRRSRLNALVLGANIVFVVVLVLYGALVGVQPRQVMPVVRADSKTARQITNLELALQRDPNSVGYAFELARLYQDLGEFPWSYDALRSAERRNIDPAWQLKFGLAYLELAKNDDALRVLKAGSARCKSKSAACAADVGVKLELFTRVAQIFVDRRIDSRSQRASAEKALSEVFKSVEVDPDKMRPKAPAAAPVAPKSVTQ